MPADFAAQTWLPLLRDLLLKSLPLFLLAGLAALALRRASASARHLVWLLLLGSLLCLPLCSALLPRWSLPVLTTRGSQPVFAPTPPIPSAPPTPASVPNGAPELPAPPTTAPVFSPVPAPLAAAAPTRPLWPARLLLLWLVGLALVAAPVLAGLARLGSLRRSGAPIAEGPVSEMALALAREIGVLRPVLLLHGPDDAARMPMTWGWARPVILLPVGAADWPADRLRAVLLHELAHIRRGDWPCQMLAHLACALYWFHPLVWLAARQMRLESERACDDLVLTAGVAPSDYARHLLEVVRSLKNVPLTVPVALPMAQSSQLERRLAMILNHACNRRRLSRRVLLAALGGGACLLVPLAMLHPTVRAQGSRPVDAPLPSWKSGLLGGTQRNLLGENTDKVPGHPERAIAQMKRLYQAITIYKHRNGTYPVEGMGQLLGDMAFYPHLYGLPDRGFAQNMRQASHVIANPDIRILQKFTGNPDTVNVYLIPGTRPDGTRVGSAKSTGTRDVLAYTSLYVQDKHGFYLVLWEDGQVEKISPRFILYVPQWGDSISTFKPLSNEALPSAIKTGRVNWVYCFPGQSGVPANTFTHDQWQQTLSFQEAPGQTPEAR